MSLGVVALVFRCRRVSGTATLSAESVEVDWLTLESLHDHMTEAFRVRVINAIHGTGVAIREHDGVRLLRE
jgi:8-oxo-dGTP diphosphatase